MCLYVRVTMKIERASQSSKTWFSVIVVARLSRDKMGPKKQIDLLWLASTDAPCLKISSQLFSFLENSGCLLFSRNSDFAWSTRKIGFPSSSEPHTNAFLRLSTCISPWTCFRSRVMIFIGHCIYFAFRLLSLNISGWPMIQVSYTNFAKV